MRLYPRITDEKPDQLPGLKLSHVKQLLVNSFWLRNGNFIWFTLSEIGFFSLNLPDSMTLLCPMPVLSHSQTCSWIQWVRSCTQVEVEEVRNGRVAFQWNLKRQ